MSDSDRRLADFPASSSSSPSPASSSASAPQGGSEDGAFQPNKAPAPRFFTGAPLQVTAGVAAMRADPYADAEMVSQALHGEEVHVYDERDDGWAWVQLQTDKYAGFVEMDALSAPVLEPTHQVTALRTYVFSEASLKSAPCFLISRTARVVVDRELGGEPRNGFLPLARGIGWVFGEHLAPLDVFAPDWVAVAESFVGAPYLWGGRESLGCDCSGLVQTALRAGGMACPRDSDQQEAALGAAIDPDAGALARGDLVFWKGHVGVMVDDTRLLHANAFHMAVACEPLAQARARIAERYGEVTSVRRLSPR